MFVGRIWIHSPSLDDFINNLSYIILLERICLERGFQKIRLKDRCKNDSNGWCKMEKIARLMVDKLPNWQIDNITTIKEEVNEP